VTVSLQKSTETPEAPVAAGPHRKPRPDLYTVLLVIALCAVLLAILFLYLEMGVYDFKVKGSPPVSMVSSQWSVVSGQWLETQFIAIAGRLPGVMPAFLIPNP
jgi:hypothetical protein